MEKNILIEYVLGKTILRSPVSGVSGQNYSVGLRKCLSEFLTF